MWHPVHLWDAFSLLRKLPKVTQEVASRAGVQSIHVCLPTQSTPFQGGYTQGNNLQSRSSRLPLLNLNKVIQELELKCLSNKWHDIVGGHIGSRSIKCWTSQGFLEKRAFWFTFAGMLPFSLIKGGFIEMHVICICGFGNFSGNYGLYGILKLKHYHW